MLSCRKFVFQKIQNLGNLEAKEKNLSTENLQLFVGKLQLLFFPTFLTHDAVDCTLRRIKTKTKLKQSHATRMTLFQPTSVWMLWVVSQIAAQ